ncbi:YfhH family protein [Metabacillus sp. GX 13764]|uniref:YfhH family protein n=1 Tax=Metabacillus kandeliae TaxID=2900151 RepID=UPI001E4190EE|nr:YfhH family protein [Metabacillus kandeliae]MCD7036378.1 YfhH family protein [Metabacillus kandeliae]
MSEYELKTEIGGLKEKARKAEQLGMINEFAVLERKIAMAKAYLLNPEDYKPGETYGIEGDPGEKFVIHYMNGVFAWGHRESTADNEEALPISMLEKTDHAGK